MRAWIGAAGLVLGVRQELDHLARLTPGALSALELAATLHHVDVARREAIAPAESLIETLHPWVAFGIMPVFALGEGGRRGTGRDARPHIVEREDAGDFGAANVSWRGVL